MEHGTTLLAVLHVLIAVVISIVILLQDTKGGVGGAFGGGGGSNSLFGATGAENFLAKTTKIFGFFFAGTCIGLTLLLSHKVNHSVVDTLPAQQAPAAAAPAAGQPATQGAPQAPGAHK